MNYITFKDDNDDVYTTTLDGIGISLVYDEELDEYRIIIPGDIEGIIVSRQTYEEIQNLIKPIKIRG